MEVVATVLLTCILPALVVGISIRGRQREYLICFDSNYQPVVLEGGLAWTRRGAMRKAPAIPPGHLPVATVFQRARLLDRLRAPPPQVRPGENVLQAAFRELDETFKVGSPEQPHTTAQGPQPLLN